jgi:hypothetical protein
VKPLTDGGGSGLEFAVDGALPVPSCNLGPDGGVCACADQSLQITDPPNIYYVLDRSGSMGNGNPTRWQTVVEAIWRVVVEIGPRATVGVTVFPSDGGDGCGGGAQVFSPRQGDAPAGVGGPVSTSLLRILGQIGPSGGTPTAATLTALPEVLQGLRGKTYVVLATDGGPNCNPDAVCDTSMCEDNIEQLGGCVAGGPNCCAPDTGGHPGDCLDATPTTAAVQAIAAMGVPVYVLGVPGSQVYSQLLNQLAAAGGTARPTPDDAGGGVLYYDASSSDQAALFSALSKIAAQITASCTLTLNAPPEDPGLLNVFLDEKPLPKQGADGGSPNWTIDGTTVTILGDACESIQSGTVLDVRVVAGCPTVIR